MALHDNGFSLADSQAEMTPIQKYVYLKGREEHFDGKNTSPSQMGKLQKFM